MMPVMFRARFILITCFLAGASPAFPQAASTLPGTKPLLESGDLSAKMVAGIDKHLMTLTEKSLADRQNLWKRDLTSPAAYEKSIQVNREHLRTILGAIDPRITNTVLEYISTSSRPAKVSETDSYTVYAVRWQV